MINPHQFTGLILEPALRAVDMYSIDAMYQMVRGFLVESKLTHIKQLPDGPALGFGQIEWATALDVFRYLNRRTDIRQKILDYCERDKLPENPRTLISDIALNVLVARVKYWMIPEPIPSYKNPEGQAYYYERYYNCNASVDKTQEFIRYSKEIEGWINHGIEQMDKGIS